MTTSLISDAPLQWMTSLGDAIRDATLSDLYMVGTHNSYSYSIRARNPPGPDAASIVRSSLRRIVAPTVTGFARNQQRTIFEQLADGVRYLDIRLAMDHPANPSEPFTSHGIFGMPLCDVVTDIRRWVDATPRSRDIVVVDLQHFAGSDRGHGTLGPTWEPLAECIAQDAALMPLSDLWARGVRVVVVAGFTACFPHRDSILVSPWHDTAHASKLDACIRELWHQPRDSRMCVTQAILTPRVSTVVRSILCAFSCCGALTCIPGSVRALAERNNDRLIAAWASGPVPQLGHRREDGRNILMLDYYDIGRYNGMDAIGLCIAQNRDYFLRK